mmetsp:Transcript_98736/g.175770  ORF Transcript_98736/g.175770 Transcript_98736/m.175770 type:complete len:208 (-) Transcript_98736:13-636(-)
MTRRGRHGWLVASLLTATVLHDGLKCFISIHATQRPTQKLSPLGILSWAAMSAPTTAYKQEKMGKDGLPNGIERNEPPWEDGVRQNWEEWGNAGTPDGQDFWEYLTTGTSRSIGAWGVVGIFAVAFLFGFLFWVIQEDTKSKIDVDAAIKRGKPDWAKVREEEENEIAEKLQAQLEEKRIFARGGVSRAALNRPEDRAGLPDEGYLG